MKYLKKHSIPAVFMKIKIKIILKFMLYTPEGLRSVREVANAIRDRNYGEHSSTPCGTKKMYKNMEIIVSVSHKERNPFT